LHSLRKALPNAAIAGSELHSKGLHFAHRRHGCAVELFQMDARRSGLADALDLVGAFDVLEHIPEDQDVLHEIGRMLTPGGILLATVPQHAWMWSTSDDLALHQRRYRRGELASKARCAGLQPLYTSSFVTLPFPMMMASRLLERMRLKKLNLQELCARQFRLSPRANAVLLGLCRLEHRLRRAGLALPFGGSQVLVARRPGTTPSKV
jgi:SAM-dependent methyltransferase